MIQKSPNPEYGRNKMDFLKKNQILKATIWVRSKGPFILIGTGLVGKRNSRRGVPLPITITK